jgi:hypothetical protein
MKKIFVFIAFAGMVGTTTAASLATFNKVNTLAYMQDDKKQDEKKHDCSKHAKGECDKGKHDCSKHAKGECHKGMSDSTKKDCSKHHGKKDCCKKGATPATPPTK